MQLHDHYDCVCELNALRALLCTLHVCLHVQSHAHLVDTIRQHPESAILAINVPAVHVRLLPCSYPVRAACQLVEGNHSSLHVSLQCIEFLPSRLSCHCCCKNSFVVAYPE